jgi:hypothetical protein
MSLSQPSRTIVVEPVEVAAQPAPPAEPAPAAAPPAEPAPSREETPAAP